MSRWLPSFSGRKNMFEIISLGSCSASSITCFAKSLEISDLTIASSSGANFVCLKSCCTGGVSNSIFTPDASDMIFVSDVICFHFGKNCATLPAVDVLHVPDRYLFKVGTNAGNSLIEALMASSCSSTFVLVVGCIFSF